MKFKKLACALLAAGFLAPTLASATNGYFSHGYGMKNKGRAGVSTAFTDDTFGGANNPAQMAFVGQRLDVGIDWFSPIREASRFGSAGGTGAFDFSEKSSAENYFIPEFGYNMMINPNMSLGVTVYGNGGMNTTYDSGAAITRGGCAALGGTNPANPLCGVGSLGVNLSQLIIAPTLAYKINEQNSIGVAPLIGYQTFKSYGLQPFGAISSFPPSVQVNPGADDAWGLGARIGWLGKFDRFSVGAAYATKIYMDKFDKYKGLFADQGSFDIPANFNAGVKFDATPQLTFGLDYQYIWYGDVEAIANSSRVPGCVPTGPFGPGAGAACLGATDSSIGFGWNNMGVIKAGVEYKPTEKWVLRAGYSWGDQPIDSADVTFNILAPGVIEQHVTLGFTYEINKESEVTMAGMYAFDNDVTGPATNPYFPVGGTETIKMHQYSLGIAYSMKW